VLRFLSQHHTRSEIPISQKNTYMKNEGYQIRNQTGIHFVTFTVIDWNFQHTRELLTILNLLKIFILLNGLIT
jgi:hypothetical protein